MEDKILQWIAQELSLTLISVTETARLLDQGNTVPFITRYRKEVTNGLNEEQIRAIQSQLEYHRTLEKRKTEIINKLEELGKITPELLTQIKDAKSLKILEDLYLPYRPKRKTKASIAKEQGLEPLAQLMLDCVAGNPEEHAQQFINENVATVQNALNGAKDIVAEFIAENIDSRNIVRNFIKEKGILRSQKTKATIENENVYKDYFDFQQSLRTIPPYRILAMNRGEKEKILSISVEVEAQPILEKLNQNYIKKDVSFSNYLREAIKDGYQRLLFTSIEREVRNELTENAHIHAIHVFTQNLRNLLLQPPMKNLCILAIDPGYISGCKLAVLSPEGDLLEYGVMFPHPPQKKLADSKKIIQQYYNKYHFQAIAIGNGTACRETEELVTQWIQESQANVVYTIVNEAGASVFSASDIARIEFPDLDASYRGTVSIGRRLLDPLAELVKIDTKSLGIGMYQHDINEKKLDQALYNVVESVVNYVGVDVNRASPELLSYIAGINKRCAKNIVEYRKKHGRFQNRLELKKVSGIGEETFTQCAGFLRIVQGDNPLDNTSIHPESYENCKILLQFLEKDANISESPLSLSNKIQKYSIAELSKQLNIGHFTLQDIIDNLQKPGRDPRESVPPPIFRKGILTIDDLSEGMILNGTVRNVLDFGAFVDIGVKINGLVHISKMANYFINSPLDVCKIGDIVQVQIISIEKERKRINLSMIFDKNLMNAGETNAKITEI